MDEGHAILGVERDDDVYWPAVWMFEAPPRFLRFGGKRRASSALMDQVLGNQLDTVHLSENAQRDRHAISVKASGKPGHVFFGPYISLPAADYSLQLTVSAPAVTDTLEIVAEVAEDGDILAQSQHAVEPTSQATTMPITLPFRTRAQSGALNLSRPCEFRLWSNCAESFAITQLQLHVTHGKRK